MYKNFTTKKAFSLVEISIVVLIVGILIAGITKGTDLYRDYKLVAAQNVTRSSIVTRTPGLSVWWETTLEESFDKNEIANGSPVTNWYTTKTVFNNNRYIATISNQTSKPKYNADGINGLPTLRFDGVGSYLRSNNFGFIKGQSLSLFVVVRRQAAGALNSAFVGVYDSYNDHNITESCVWFYEHYGGQIGPYCNNVTKSRFFGPSNNVNYVASTIFADGRNITYLNGKPGENVNWDQYPWYSYNPFFNNIYIGSRFYDGVPKNFYNGDIGEIIIFERGLNSKEHYQVLEYLGKKWGIKISK